MALCYLLDEHLRGPLWRAIQQHRVGGGKPPAPGDVALAHKEVLFIDDFT